MENWWTDEREARLQELLNMDQDRWSAGLKRTVAEYFRGNIDATSKADAISVWILSGEPE